MTTERSEYTGQRIIDWYDEPYTLHDRDGDKIGQIVEINPAFIVAESDGGFLGLGDRHTFYVPRTHISRDEGSDWFLTVDKDEIEALGFASPPTGTEFGTEEWRSQYGYDPDAPSEGRMRMIRYEEDLQAQKVDRQAGEVTVRKDVVEETQTLEVPVRREEVHVERRPVTDAAVAYEDGDTAFQETEQEIRVPVMAEEVEVRKVVRPVEEVVVTKTATDETRQVTDTVRKERFDVEDTTEEIVETDTQKSVR